MNDLDSSNSFRSLESPHRSWEANQDVAMNVDPPTNGSSEGNLEQAIMRNFYSSIPENSNLVPRSTSTPSEPSSAASNTLPSTSTAPTPVEKQPLTSNQPKAITTQPTIPISNPKPTTTSTTSTSRRSSLSAIDILSKFGKNNPSPHNNVNDLMSRLEISTPTSSTDSTPLNITTPLERKALLDKLNKLDSQPYFKALLNDPRAIALLSSWITDVIPPKGDDTVTNPEWTPTLMPLLRVSLRRACLLFSESQ